MCRRAGGQDDHRATIVAALDEACDNGLPDTFKKALMSTTAKPATVTRAVVHQQRLTSAIPAEATAAKSLTHVRALVEHAPAALNRVTGSASGQAATNAGVDTRPAEAV